MQSKNLVKMVREIILPYSITYLHRLKKSLSSQHHIVIIDPVHPVLLDILKEHHVVYVPHVAESDIESVLQDATILIVRTKIYVDASYIAMAPKLQLIGRLGSGMDNIDTHYAELHHIACINAPEGNRNAVAEQTIGMMLSLLAKINKGHKEVSAGLWQRKENEGVELGNRCVGIIGYGNVGSTLAAKLSSFGCKVLAYDLYKSNFASEHVEEVSLAELQKRADIVSLHVPLNMQSQAMINTDFIQKMEKPFYLLKLARGKLCVLSDLICGLESKKISGAALDVLPNEKLDTMNEHEQSELAYLVNCDRVILTPHIGGLTKESYIKLAEILGNKIIKWVQSHPLVNPK
jgi:D-3-phosphoglycerate dehydrogenase / 2-oxoglutarate reductase